MEPNSINKVFESRLRLSIIAELTSGIKTFSELKRITGSTDGNLSVQLEKLKQERFISENKEFRNKRPCTTYTLTEEGMEGLKQYVAILQEVLNSGTNQRK